MITDDGTILRTHALGESGLIVVWSTYEHGVMRTAARGALRPGGAFSGRLDLFHACELEWTPPRRGNLCALTGVRLKSPRLNLRKDLSALRLAGYMVQLLVGTVEQRTPIPEFHVLLERALDYLDAHGASLRLMTHFEKRLAEKHGVLAPGRNPADCLEGCFGRLPSGRDALMRLLS
ncbi:MAG: recombination protein O N-terminal domain-containing protein [Akkermansiaceae bacterium]|nr:recombination protein O N-terminal domain-containing protein [Akkermansiaceae bacterium]